MDVHQSKSWKPLIKVQSNIMNFNFNTILYVKITLIFLVDTTYGSITEIKKVQIRVVPADYRMDMQECKRNWMAMSVGKRNAR